MSREVEVLKIFHSLEQFVTLDSGDEQGAL